MLYQYIDQLKEQCTTPFPSEIVVGHNFALKTNRVFLPEHKDKRYLDYYMACLDDKTALTGSDGEPKMYSVIRRGSTVKILEIVEITTKPEKEIFYQQSEGETELKLFKIYDTGTSFKFNEPIKLYFMKIEVIDYVTAPVTTIYDPIGWSMEFEGAKAEAPDYTGGFIEDNGVVGYVFVQSVRDDFTYTVELPENKIKARGRK